MLILIDEIVSAADLERWAVHGRRRRQSQLIVRVDGHWCTLQATIAAKVCAASSLRLGFNDTWIINHI